MTLPELKVIPAGAGSGKTYTLQEQLGEWVVKGLVSPDRIVAVTFTEAAASELRERIKTKLLSLGRVDDALKLDKAYISTIHGFGLRILTEFAFDMGSTPQPKLLTEEESDMLIRLALAQTDKAHRITADLGRFGYRSDYMSGRSREDSFRSTLLAVVALLRSMGANAGNSAIVRESVERLVARYGAIGSGIQVTAKLKKSVQALLKVYPFSLADEFGASKSATSAFQANYSALRRANDSDDLDWDWSLWQSLRSLRQSKRGNPLPVEYDELAQSVMDAADALPTHPGPLAHEKEHIETLIVAAQDILGHYNDAKRNAGLVDYSDMIAMAGELLRARPGVLKTLVSRVDCMVVDEFQDTNPLQFDLLWQLKSAGVPTIVVGDMKQAIMGFQGADPRLFEQIIQQYQDCAEPLARNWRSEKRIIEFINQLGVGLFGDDYDPLKPTRKEAAEHHSLEIMAYREKPKSGAHLFRADTVGRKLVKLLADKYFLIEDKRTGVSRNLRGSDIAVLCPSHNMLGQYADQLRGLGLKVRLQEEGWLESELIQTVWHALAYVANPRDRHAALYLAVSPLSSKSLQIALEELIAENRIIDPLLSALDAIRPEIQSSAVYAALNIVLSAIGIWDEIKQWADAEQARANLLRLTAEAQEFQEANREALASTGLYGSGLQTFLTWLSGKASLNNKQPDPAVVDEDAIVLSTWHSCKGKEWPVVAVCGLDKEVSARLPTIQTSYSSFGDLRNLLTKAVIDYSPNFTAPEATAKFSESLQLVSEIEAKRLLYVALTRPRDKLILEWPAYQKLEKVTMYSLLVNSAKMFVEPGKVKVGRKSFPCAVDHYDVAEVETNGNKAKIKLPLYGRRAIKSGQSMAATAPDSIAPSTYTQYGTKSFANTKIIRYSDGLSLRVKLSGSDYGTLLHQSFEIISHRPELIEEIPAITGINMAKKDLSDLADSVGEFHATVISELSPASVEYEVPVLAKLETGSVVSGAIDMLVRTEDGVWVIDHKSDRPGCEQGGLSKYASQLECYAAALSAIGEKVLGVGIHWISDGSLELAHTM